MPADGVQRTSTPDAAASTPNDDTAPTHAPGFAANVAFPRGVRSFVVRAGRTTTGQARALAELGPRYVLPYDAATTDLVAACADAAGAGGQKYTQTVLEIGFGMGQATAHIAALRPDTLFIGCEVHEPGVGALLKLLGEQQLANVRILQHDAVQVLQDMVAPASLHGVHIFFPDPWHKKRHHKRRLIQPRLVRLLAERLAPGGYLHCATDWEPYAEQMLQVLAAEPLLTNTATGYAPKPDYRPETKFERRGLKLGHGVWDLVFRRNDVPVADAPPLVAGADSLSDQ
ncbi:tRNA (guanosine(46)-N7)-methyltransferase TrmB [Ottowia oryzae]|uniref:tRNA (guanine-N(7)-)-methyltransferase n=1 Tax=Ottowia oryzae TaxID=2109914 RepID=A0A2S0MJF6_9BURK|nr:tRNA (guanosine(46)-N7)-methyltransferase TrmB [Ottowia oryzae]AVO36025.1 tRNA (guanosine(46)-N7)-methyltransferase TrmB [Ottowia oryzae]